MMGRIAFAADISKRIRGLLFRDEFLGELLLIPCRSVHTFGMRKPIDIAFVNNEGEVISSFLRVEPRRHICELGSYAVIERFSKEGSYWYEPGDRVYFDVEKGNR